MKRGRRMDMSAAVAILALLGAGVGVAEAAQGPIEPVPRSFRESINRPEPVGASAALGAVIASGDSIRDVRRLVLNFKQQFSGTVVIQLITADGKYSGYARYQIASAPANSSQTISFPTAHLRTLRAYTPRTLAISAHSEGSRAGRRYFPVSFADEPGGGMLLLYLMGQGAEVYLVDRVARKLRKCDRVTGVSGIKFDTICPVAPGRVDWGRGVTLRRVRGGTQLDDVTIAF